MCVLEATVTREVCLCVKKLVTTDNRKTVRNCTSNNTRKILWQRKEKRENKNDISRVQNTHKKLLNLRSFFKIEFSSCFRFVFFLPGYFC